MDLIKYNNFIGRVYYYAIECRNLNKYEEAIESYKYIIKIDKQEYKEKASWGLARTYRSLNKIEEAFNLYKTNYESFVIKNLTYPIEMLVISNEADKHEYIKEQDIEEKIRNLSLVFKIENIEKIINEIEKDKKGVFTDKFEKKIEKLIKSKIYYNKNQKKLAEKNRIKRQQNLEDIRTKDRKYRQRTKNQRAKNRKKLHEKYWERAIEFFGPCPFCGENRRELLAIDHINNDGNIKRKKGEEGGKNLLSKFNALGWPESLKEEYRLLCHNHNMRFKTKTHLSLWKEALLFFGPCSCCGNSNIKDLTIDHINGGGNRRRKKGEKNGWQLIQKFKKDGWKKEIKNEYRLLCWECNKSLGHFGYCPHQKENKEELISSLFS